MKNHTKIFLIYGTLYETSVDSKLLRIRFDKIDGIIRILFFCLI